MLDNLLEKILYLVRDIVGRGWVRGDNLMGDVLVVSLFGNILLL